MTILHDGLLELFPVRGSQGCKYELREVIVRGVGSACLSKLARSCATAALLCFSLSCSAYNLTRRCLIMTTSRLPRLFYFSECKTLAMPEEERGSTHS